MKTKVQKYSLLLLGIFLISLGLRSVHFLEHHTDHTAVHKCDNHDSLHHNQDKDSDCPLCDFTLSLVTGIEFFSFELFYPDRFNTKTVSHYTSYISSSDYRFFSLRAPPMVYLS